ncbi:MAG: hypothetical protein QOF89_6065 [Acidobacteriota bacterium]|jgi:hypothetical protein|nr:hypothetical protein [Acidobacteriota bacterium]
MSTTTRIAWVFLLLAGASAASATTYVAMSDEDLTDQAAVVARVKVVDVAPGPASAMPATDYLVEVEEVAKGHLPGSTVAVRVPGGVRADGVGLKVWGAPELRPGEETLLFLEPAPDGSFRILHLMLGAFRARTAEKSTLAVRDLSEMHRLRRAAGADLDEPGVRDLDRFAAWIADRALGLRRAPDYWRKVPEEKYAQINGPDNLPVRWFTFDSGRSVSWKMDPAGQPGLDPAQSEAALRAALDAWNADPTSTIQYIYAGTTTATGGLRATDGVNAVTFNDPGNVHVPGTFDCRAGGILAMGGPYFYPSTRSYRGQSYHEAFEANVVVNDGTQCYFANNPVVLAEVLAHELGHTLGFNHSAEGNALMRATAHNDGRGARLADDDRMAASSVYGDGSFQPAPPPPPTVSTPLKLTAAPASRTEIRLAWANAPQQTEELRLECQEKGGAYRPLQTLPAETTETVLGGLKANSTYVFRVVAVDAAGRAVGVSNGVRVRTRK